MPSLKIEIAEPIRRPLRALDDDQRRRMGKAIDQVAAAWGKPHLHGGAGIRNFGRDYFECRSGLQSRLIFKALPGALYFVFMGNHDEIRVFIRLTR